MESTQQHRHGNCTEAFIVHTLNYIRVFNLRMLPRENFYSLFSELPFSYPQFQEIQKQQVQLQICWHFQSCTGLGCSAT